MTFVVRRSAGRWEIRESVTTPAGPRARTLATFRVLDDAALAKAEAGAMTSFERRDVIARARRAGAAVGESRVDTAARALLHELAAGDEPRPGLTRLLRDRLARLPSGTLGSGDSIAEWIGASEEDRGLALRDLLEVADRLPAPRRGRLQFPGLRSVAAGG